MSAKLGAPNWRGALCSAVVLNWAWPVAAFDVTATQAQIATMPSQEAKRISRTNPLLPDENGQLHCDDNLTARPLHLAAAVELALCSHPQLRAARAGLRAQAAAVGEARAAFLPTLSATTTRLRTKTTYPDADMSSLASGQTNYLALNWRLFDFGGRSANQASANSLLAAALASRDDTVQKVLGGAVEAYFNVQNAQAGMLAMEKSEAIARDLLESAKRRGKNGQAARSDILQAQTAYARAVLEKNRMAGTLSKALAMMTHAIGLAPGGLPVLASPNYDASEELNAPLAISGAAAELQQLLLDAERYHPQIDAANAQWQAALHRADAVRAEGLPTLDLTANYSQNGYPGQGLSSSRTRVGSIGFSLNFPLFDGFSHTYKVRRAQAEAQQRQAELEDIRQTVLAEVIKAQADAVAALKNLGASRDLLDAAEQSLSSARHRYELGVADIQEILNTQRALADAELERIRCLGDWGSTRLRLMNSVGTLTLDTLHSVERGR